MTSNEQQTNKQLTAAQRIQGLEQALGALDQALYNQTKQMETMRDVIVGLSDRLTAVTTLLSLNQLVSNETIDSVIESKRVEEMKTKVNDLVQAGSLEKTEEVSDKSFLVVREMNAETGAVINPRLQFVSQALNPESLKKILGKKAGESVKFVDDNPAVIEIEEIYNISSKTGQAPEAQAQV